MYPQDKRLALKTTPLFKSTNKIWNDYGFNQRDSIGSTMYLIRKRRPETFREWAAYYFDTGFKRLELLQNPNLTPHQKRDINFFYGRTGKELAVIARKFAQVAGINQELANNYVCIRILDETWEGYLREESGYTAIKKECYKYKNFTVVESSNSVDLNYAVDFEIKYNGKVVLGIQIKPPTFEHSKLDGVADSWEQNLEKHRKYRQRYGADTMFLYIDKGNITNKAVLTNWLNNYIYNKTIAV